MANRASGRTLFLVGSIGGLRYLFFLRECEFLCTPGNGDLDRSNRTFQKNDEQLRRSSCLALAFLGTPQATHDKRGDKTRLGVYQSYFLLETS
jgi:hypothetical protein